MNAKLEIHYDEETDTLSVWNGRPVFSSYEVQHNLLIEMDADRTPVGFTLEHALELLQAHLSGNSTPADTAPTGHIPGGQSGSAVKKLTQPVFPDDNLRNYPSVPGG